jgi:RimJ/RimL family protein N-acetyltransferase
LIIRKLEDKDADQFSAMLKKLDEETIHMLFEPGERQVTQEDVIRTVKRREESNSLTLVAEVNGKIVGFVSADRGFANRIKHSVFIVTGILSDYRGKGIGSKLFENLIIWATKNEVQRLELTVMTHNEVALKLYKKIGFKIEGLKERSMIVNGEYIDEYYMAKLIDDNELI